MAFRGFKVWINAEGNRAVNNEFSRIKKSHKKHNGMAFVFRHLFPVVQVFSESDFVRKPSISDGLVIKIISPLIIQRVQVHIVRRRFSDKHSFYVTYS